MLLLMLPVSVAVSEFPGNYPRPERLVSVAGTGDIMPGSSFPSARYLPPGDNPV